MNLLESARQMFRYNAVQYHGLLNQGATSYLNSVLQVMFMTKDFTEAMERYTSENPDTEGIDRHLKTLFDDLKGHTAYTYNITKKLHIDRVYEERDAAEYFEKILNLTSPEASQIFRGLLTHRTKCSTCFTETDTDGAFWHLPLALVNSYSEHYSVVDGIEEYFRTTEFSGENQMYCEHCDDKSDATTQSVIKHHPEVLMLLLKRFEFSYCYMTYVKINCIVDVPCILQIPENQTYELYAVVDHVGDHRSGHYTATIKDDERWYNFNDSRVSLSDYQSSNLETSSSAYLLFYRRRKVHAASTCTQDIREVSPPGAFPSDIVDIVAENGVHKGQSIPCSQGYKEERNYQSYSQDAHDRKQRDEEKIIMHDKEDMGGNAETNEQAVKKRKTFSRETELEEIVEDQGNGSGRPHDVRQRGPLEGYDIHNTSHHNQKQEQEFSNMNAREEYPQQVCVRVEDMMDVNRDKDGKMSGDELSGRRDLNRDVEHVRQEISVKNKDVAVETKKQEETRYNNPIQDRADSSLRRTGSAGSSRLTENQGVDSDEKTRHRQPKVRPEYNEDRVEERRGSKNTKTYQDSGGLDSIRQNISENLVGTRKVGQDYVFKPASVDEQGDEERMKRVVEVDRERKTGADERGLASGGSTLLTKYDLYSHQIQDNRRVCDSEQNMLKYDQESKQRSSSKYKRHEQHKEETRDVKGDKEQKRGHDKHLQSRETERRQHFGRDVEVQNIRGLDVRQKTSVTHTINKDVAVETKEQEETGYNKPIQDRADSSLRQRGSAGSSRLNQGVDIIEDRVEERHGSKKTKTYQVKIIEEEITENPSGTQRSCERKHIGTVEETSQQDTLSEGVHNLKLSEGNKCGTKRANRNVEDKNEISATIDSTSVKKQKQNSDKKDEEKRKLRFIPFKKKTKEKKNKTTGLFSLLSGCKNKTNSGLDSEED
uniref:USP domain-containing protein n=2 Tax=Dicentrarchus labrax TaxID=13489 RepID=A0A8P4KCZ9_DICLA